jgi:hypothetical protein
VNDLLTGHPIHHLREPFSNRISAIKSSLFDIITCPAVRVTKSKGATWSAYHLNCDHPVGLQSMSLQLL